MASEYEISAKRAAVDAVEKRWQAREKANATTTHNQLFKRAVVVVAGIIIFVLALHVVMSRSGYELGSLCKAVDFLHLREDAATEAKTKAYRKYAEVVSLFKSGKSAVWREAPETIRPKSAVAGTSYYALVLDADGNYDIYEMTATGGGGVSVWLLSPFVEPKVTTMSEFKENRQGKKYFIEHAGVVYACGGLSESAVENLRGL